MKTYNSYKDVEFDWLAKIPKHWKICRLKDVLQLGTGLSITKQNLKPTGVPCVSYGEIHSKYGVNLDTTIHSLKCVDESYLDNSPKAIIRKGDFVFADTSEDVEGAGNFTHLRNDCEIFAGYHTVTAKPVKVINSTFFAFLFDSKNYRTQVRKSIKGVKVFSVTQSILKNTKVWMPPLEEQTQIANYLEHKTTQIDALIAKKEQLIKLLAEERTAIINQAVTKGLNPSAPMKDSGIEWLGEIPEHWEVPKMKFLCEFILDGTHGTHRRTEDGYRLLSVRNIVNGKFVFRDDDSKISKDEFLKITSRFTVQENDIQLAIVGATLGKVALVPRMDEKIATQRSLATIRLDSKQCLPQFMYYFMLSDSFQTYLWSNTGFSAQPGIYLGSIQNCPVSIPSIEEQQIIVENLNEQIIKIDGTFQVLKKEIELIHEYKTALISEVVTGKVDVRSEKLN